jgi:hypothetical protein
VPPPEEAGIFDRLDGSPEERVAEGAELVRDLATALTESYGVVFRRWVRTLMKKDPSKRVGKLIDRFVEHVKPQGAHERRIAEKFGLLYAAGRMAVEDGLLPWDSGLPPSATSRLYRRAITQEVHPSATLKEDLRALTQAVRSEERCPRIANGETLEIDDVRVVIGARCKHHGKRIIALRHDGLTAVISDPERADALLRHLQRKGALQPGHGGKAAQQFALPVRIDASLFGARGISSLTPRPLQRPPAE